MTKIKKWNYRKLTYLIVIPRVQTHNSTCWYCGKKKKITFKSNKINDYIVEINKITISLNVM